MFKKNSALRGIAGKAAAVLLMLLIFRGLIGNTGADRAEEGEKDGNHSLGSSMRRELAETVKSEIYDSYLLCISFAAGKGEPCPILREQLENLLPLYSYAAGGLEGEEDERDPGQAFRELLLAEAEEGTSAIPEASGQEEMKEEDASLSRLFEEENEAVRTPGEANEPPSDSGRGEAVPFVPHERIAEADLESLQDYETLLRQFYTVDSNTMIGSDQLNIEEFLEKDLTVSREGEGPQILIFHTHSRESFADSLPGDPAQTILGVGDRLAQILTETYGYQVLHHTESYDAETRDDAYSRALPGIEQVLRENPSIQVVIDLHRDEVPEETRLVLDLDGRPTARFMFFNGLSRTKKTGNIAYLYNENLEDNLAFSFQMQLKAAEYYPGLTRKIYLKGYRYNMHLKDKYLLVELGAQNNTVEEAMNACDPLAHILDLVLRGE
ncbi:MAG: stage II sporulation protein P [Roseburia sp.]|nr:stage II sporulation protein P [Roseburia sp.]MCM1098649.1 stage II sporulation protein P [Ruminococcus flavefaciens]